MKYKGTKIVKLCLLRLFLCSKWEFFERLAAIGIFDLSGFHLVKRKEATIKDQYDRINAMKLDKSVFEATMMQLNTVQNDLHEIRADIRELLKCQSQH